MPPRKRTLPPLDGEIDPSMLEEPEEGESEEAETEAKQPAAERQSVIMVHDDITLMLREQSKHGLRTIDDFDEGAFNEEATDYPKVIPQVINGRKVRAVGLNHKVPHMHPLYPYCTPVTRDLIPTIDRSALNAAGFLQTGTHVWFVIDQDVYDRVKKGQKRLMEQRIKGLSRSKADALLNENGGFDSGIKKVELVKP